MMEIVIKIDDKLYNRIKYLEPKADTMLDELMRSIQSGTPLPKGHGRIIDADDIALIDEQFYVPSDYYVAESAIDHTPTIIGADKEE